MEGATDEGAAAAAAAVVALVAGVAAGGAGEETGAGAGEETMTFTSVGATVKADDAMLLTAEKVEENEEYSACSSKRRNTSDVHAASMPCRLARRVLSDGRLPPGPS